MTLHATSAWCLERGMVSRMKQTYAARMCPGEGSRCIPCVRCPHILFVRSARNQAYLAYQFQDSHLQDIPPVRNIVHLAEQVVHSSVLCVIAEHQESITLCGQILLAVKHFLYQVGSILQMHLPFWELVYTIDG